MNTPFGSSETPLSNIISVQLDLMKRLTAKLSNITKVAVLSTGRFYFRLFTAQRFIQSSRTQKIKCSAFQELSIDIHLRSFPVKSNEVKSL